MNLYVINWILQQKYDRSSLRITCSIPTELRRALEQLGRGRIFSKAQNVNEEEMDMAINEVMAAARVMSREHTGALIVLNVKWASMTSWIQAF